MKKFINRDVERKALELEYQKDSSALVILYGRRRVGKTALSAEFMKNKNALYFLVTEESEIQNRIAFKNMVANYSDNALLKNAIVDDWLLIFKEWLNFKTKYKKLLIIDEFQYLGKSNQAFPSIFQKIWDTMLKDENVMVILCGSLITMMESQTLNYGSPLYGRRTRQIKLKQIPFRHYNKFFPDKSRRELIEYYSVTGGIPKYIELFEQSSSIYKSIENNILSRSSFLYDEPNFLLQSEVSEVGSYFSVIKTIAAGNQKLSKIAASLELKQTGLTRYLKTLIDLDILEREVPITEENPEKSKKGLYKIKDNFILFWFRFIFPNLSFIESGNEQIVLKKIKNNLVDNHISFVYEDVCIEELWEIAGQDTLPFQFDKVGRWWNNNTEIDIIAYDSTGCDIAFCECKYWENKKAGLDVLRSLEEKAKQVEWKQQERREYFVLFSISGFTEELLSLSKIRNDIFLFS